MALESPTIKSFSASPRPLAWFSGVLWGVRDSTDSLYKSADGGKHWYPVLGNLPTTVASALYETTDGEVLVGATLGVWKSDGWGAGEPSWSQVLDVVDGSTAYLLDWGLDGDGTKFVATHYASAGNWADSRYVWISTDSGDTWTQVRDDGGASDTHMHGCCYDRWGDKFYVSEGHGSNLGIYCSDDDGGSWTLVEGNGLYSTAAPTVLVAAPGGLVCGSDNDNDGIYTLPRGEESSGLQWAWEWESSKSPVLNGFAIHGYVDESTGVAYVGFQSDHSDLPAVIAQSDGSTASLAYTDTENEQGFSHVVASYGEVSASSDRADESYFFGLYGDSMSGILDRALLLLQAKNYSGSGNWLDESGNDLDASISGATFLDHDGANYVWLDGSNGANRLSLPSSAALNVSTGLDIRAKISPTSVSPTPTYGIVSKYTTGTNDRSYRLNIKGASAGLLQLVTSANGVATVGSDSTAGLVAAGFSPGDTFWVRAHRTFTGGGTTKFYTSTDGTNWTQLGDTLASGDTSVYASSAVVDIGVDYNQTTNPFNGDIYEVQIYDGDGESGGTLVLDVNMDDATEPFSTFAERANAATVTINRHTSGYRATVVDEPQFAFSTNDVMTIADDDLLDFGLTDSFSVVARVRVEDASASEGFVVKALSGYASGSAGWSLNNSATDDYAQFRTYGGSATVSLTPATLAARTVANVVGVRNVTADTLTAYVNGVAGTAVEDAASATLANAANVKIGADQHTSTAFLEGQVMAVAVFAEALTPGAANIVGLVLGGADDPFTLEGDALKAWILENDPNWTSSSSLELVGLLNELNGTTGKGYAEARGTYLGAPPAG